MTTVSWPEAAWTLTALVCLCINATLLRRAVERRRLVRRSGENGALLLVATGSIEEESYATAVQVIALAVGLLAAVTPDPIRAEVRLTDSVTALALIAIEVLLAFRSVRRYWRRERLVRLLTRQQRALARLADRSVRIEGLVE